MAIVGTTASRALRPRSSTERPSDAYTAPIGDQHEIDSGRDPSLSEARRRERVRAALFEGQPLPRERLGRFILLDVLGKGGMGTVLRAHDQRLDRQVALKVLHPAVAERHAARLVREAQALAKLSHPNVVQVYEVGEAETRTFIAMELVRGKTLHRWQRESPGPPWRALVEAYLQAGAGLAAAHAAGLVHRDFKPANCIIDDEGRARVLDFGLVREADEPSPPASAGDCSPGEAPEGDSALTGTGAMLGTLAYMPPEQMQGLSADARSDQFSFCVSLYEAVYGERPFFDEQLRAHKLTGAVAEVRPAPKGSRVPTTLRRVLLRGLSSDREARWPSMDALLAALRQQVAPRRRRRLGLGLGLAIAGGSLVALRYTGEEPRCEGARAQLEGVWDDARKQEVEAALLGTELSYAEATWVRVEQRLDDYGRDWVSKREEVCEATRIHGEQTEEVMDLRVACLSRQRIALRKSIDVLVHADQTAVKRAVTLVASLPDLSRCDDVNALRSGLTLPSQREVIVPPEVLPPEDSPVANERERLAEARALRKVGLYEQAAAVIQEVVDRAEVLGHAPLMAEARLERANVRRARAEYADAEEDLEAAYLLAVELGHRAVEEEATSRLVFTVGVEQGRYAEGQQWAKLALALARRPDADDRVEGLTLNNVGAVLMQQGDLDGALDYYRQALAVWERALGPRHPNVATPLNNIGLALRQQRELDGALEHYQRALRIWEDALGPQHPDVAGSLNNIGGVLQMQGRLDEAREYYEQALQIREDALGSEHPDLAETLVNIGTLLQTQDRLEDALRYHERAFTLWERALGPEHQSLAVALNNIGMVLQHQGKLDEARGKHQRALAIFEGALGPEHPTLAWPLIALADIALDRQDFEVAREHAERAVSVRATRGVSDEVLAAARFKLARALWTRPQQQGRAAAVATQARDAYASLGEAHQDKLEQVQAWLDDHPPPSSRR